MSVDPRLNKRPHGDAALAAGAVTAAPKRVRVHQPPKDTQFYRLVSSDLMQLSYLCEVKANAHRHSDVKPKSMRHTDVNELVAAINSIDFSPDGNFLAATTGDDTIILMDLKHREPGKTINPVKKYGANLIKMLIHHKAVHSSTRTDNDLRLLDLFNNNYIRYFKGHTGQVCSLDVTSTARTIISAAAVEKKVFLWDIDQLKPTACLRVGSGIPSLRQWPDSEFGNELPNLKPRSIAFPQPVVAFDPTNAVFAVAARESPNEYVRLYDLRYLSKGPFQTWNYSLVDKIYDCFPKNGSVDARMCAVTAMSSDFTDLKFSPDGRLLLLNTSGPYFYIIDSLTGKVKKTVLREGRTYNNTLQGNRAPEVSFAPDSEYVFGGNGSPADPRIYCWSVRSGQVVGILNKDAKNNSNNPNFAMNYVRHNPVSYMIAAAGGQRISLYRSVRYMESNGSKEYDSSLTF